MEGFMPLPYSADLRERVLSAHEHGEGNAATLAARFRVAVNTVKNWVRAAVTEGRRVAKPSGHGPAPRLGAAERAVLCQLVAADNDATLAEYGARLAAQTGVHVSQPVLSVTLKRLGLSRKKRRSGRASRGAPTSPPNARPLPRRSRPSRPRTSSFLTRPGSAPM
jgi:transposase